MSNISYFLAQADLTLMNDQVQSGIGLQFLPAEASLLQTLLSANGDPSTITTLGSTPVTYNVTYGTSADDIINLSTSFKNNIVFAGNGNNTIIGGLGNDIIIGGSGADDLMGGLGNNILIAGSGTEKLSGLIDFATVPLGGISTTDLNVHNTLIGGSGNDTMAGIALSGVVIFSSTTINDHLHIAGQTLIAGSGNTNMYGDIQTVDPTGETTTPLTWTERYSIDANILYGGAGTDLLVGNFGHMQWHQGVETVDKMLTLGDNQLYAGSGTNTLIGSVDVALPGSLNSAGTEVFNYGNNLLVGGSGSDLMIGTIRSLTAIVNPSQEVLTLNFGNNTLIAGTGNDVMWGAVQSIAAGSNPS